MLTPKNIEDAKKLRAEKNWGWNKICLHLGISKFLLLCEIQPGYREFMRNKSNSYRAGRAGLPRPRKTKKQYLHHAPGSGPMVVIGHRLGIDKPKVPDYVQFEAERAATVPRTLTAIICGDPAYGRSALDRKGA